MARHVYACCFDIDTGVGISDVLSIYKRWISEHYRKQYNLSKFDFNPEASGVFDGVPEKHELSSINYQKNTDRAVRIRWSHPDSKDAGMRWTNEVRIGQFDNKCLIEHLIALESIEYNISPPKYQLGSPKVIRTLSSKYQPEIGAMKVKAEPYILKKDDLDILMELLTSDQRKIPVILLSPYSDDRKNKIDPKKIARNLAGVAVVVFFENLELTWDFSDEVGRKLSCFNGAARIYWPGFTYEANPWDHKLYLGEWIDQYGGTYASRMIEHTIFSIAAYRYVPNKRISNLIRGFESSERMKILKGEKENEQLWSELERVYRECDELKDLIDELKSENANIKANQMVFLNPDLDISGIDTYSGSDDEDEKNNFSSVIDAVEAASGRFKNLEILSSAISSARSSPFMRPYDIYHALSDLDSYVKIWKTDQKEKKASGDIITYLRSKGWGRCSMHISPTTRGKYRSDYEFEYQGEKQLFEPHITFGARDPNKCASIHFKFDSARKKIIVAHAGRHLRNTKT